jgi:hypothetical protein
MARIKNGFGITQVFIPIIISMYVNLRVYGHVYVYAYLQEYEVEHEEVGGCALRHKAQLVGDTVCSLVHTDRQFTECYSRDGYIQQDIRET